jgi:LysM repeat protein
MMQALRQLGGGVIIAIISVVLVLGGISLALAESLPPPTAPTQVPPTLPLTFPTPTAAPGLETPTLPGETPTETATTIPSSPTATLFVPTTCAYPAGWIAILTTSNDTIYSLAQRYNTTTDMLSAGNCLPSINLPAGYLLYVPPVAATAIVIPCVPPAGWVKTHIVQPGDNLYRIALSYGLTYPQLQAANCMGSSILIYAGQKLWVPNIPTLTPIPGVIITLEFPTVTPSPTSLPPTETVPPTATVSPTPTSTFMVTATFPTSTPTLTPFPSNTKTP